MATFKIVFRDGAKPEEGAVMFVVSRPTEGEAIELATRLFAERYPDKRLEDYEVQSIAEQKGSSN
jgi:hypothetical protein